VQQLLILALLVCQLDSNQQVNTFEWSQMHMDCIVCFFQRSAPISMVLQLFCIQQCLHLTKSCFSSHATNAVTDQSMVSKMFPVEHRHCKALM